MLSWVEHDKSFITLGPGHSNAVKRVGIIIIWVAMWEKYPMAYALSDNPGQKVWKSPTFWCIYNKQDE